MKEQIAKFSLKQALSYIEKNPEENFPKLLNLVDAVAGDGPDSFPDHRRGIREAIDNPDSSMYKFIMGLFNDIDNDVLKKTFENFFLNAGIFSAPKLTKSKEKYNCNVPFTILLDPTSACNLHCTGCWAAEYGNKLNLTNEEIDSIITQGKELGIYMYIFTGGEPLVRKKDLLEICRKHNDVQFLCFTNGTLIDDEFAEELLKVKNFIPALSIEGFEDATDFRRGEGTYAKVKNAMRILREHKLPFGASCCYTSKNMDSIASDEFFDDLIAEGVKFMFLFHYMPVGNEADTDLLPTPEQRKQIIDKVREVRATKPIFPMDFQNDARFVGGCIAGGRQYLHINANGDVDPCVFIHYSNANIRDKSLIECLQSKIFMEYKENIPFNENQFRPCPMLENPGMIQEMVKRSGAHSTDLQSPETVDNLFTKCEDYAANWTPTADEVWERVKKEKKEKEKAKVK